MTTEETLFDEKVKIMDELKNRYQQLKYIQDEEVKKIFTTYVQEKEKELKNLL